MVYCLSLGDEAELKLITGNVDTIGVLPVVGVNAIDTTLGSAGLWVWAEVLVPGIASVAVRGGTSLVEQSPVGVQSDGFGSLIAATKGTFSERQLGMQILLLLSNLLP